MDVSADLCELGRTPVLVVSAKEPTPVVPGERVYACQHCPQIRSVPPG